MILILFLLTLAIGLLAQWHVKRTYARHNRTPTTGGYTGAEAAHAVLRQAGITNVSIVEHEELLGDHYDPRHKRLVLSSANYHGTSRRRWGWRRTNAAIPVSTAEIVLERERDCAPAFRAQVHLAVPGPDIHATARDHTLEAVWLKVTKNLRQQIEWRKTRQHHKLKSNRSLSAPASRWAGAMAGQRA